MDEVGLDGRTDILNANVTDGGPAGNADVYYKARVFFPDMLPVKVLVSILYSIQHCNKIPSLRKNQHNTITLRICKTEF